MEYWIYMEYSKISEVIFKDLSHNKLKISIK